MQTSHGPGWAAPGLLLAVGGLLALSVLLSKLAAAAGLPMLWFLAGVMLLSGAGLTGVAAASGRLGPVRRVLPYASGAGAIYALASAMGYLSVAQVGAGYVALMMALPILLTWLLALLLGLERFAGRRAFGVAAGLAGGLTLALAKLAETRAGGGAVYVLAASAIPVVLAAGNIYRTRYWPAGVDALPLAALSLLLGGGLAAVAAAVAEGMRLPSTGPAGLLLLVSAAVVGVQNLLQFRLQGLAGPVYMSQIGSVAALFGVALARLWLDEPLPAALPVALLLVTAGVVAFQLPRRSSTVAERGKA